MGEMEHARRILRGKWSTFHELLSENTTTRWIQRIHDG